MDAGHYGTTYGTNFYPRSGQKFFPKAKAIPEIDPNLTAGHFANNITYNGYPIESKTWDKPKIDNVPEEYKAFLERYKKLNSSRFQKLFLNPDVNFAPVEASIKDAKLTTYLATYSPDYYVRSKEELKWQSEDSKYKYRQTTYDMHFNRIDEIADGAVSRPFVKRHDEEQLKKELRKIYKPTQTTYYRLICADRIPEMKDRLKEKKVWKPPLDAHTSRRI